MFIDATSKKVDRVLESLFVGGDEAMAETLRRSDDAGLAPIAVSPMQGLFLNILAGAVGARRILEIGALGGYSTLWLARALPEGGRVTSLEISPENAAVARANAESAGLSQRVEIVVGPALASLDAMIARSEPAFDFVFIDADKESYPLYLDRTLKLVRRGALIIADNVVRKGEAANDKTKDPLARGAADYLKRAADDARLRTSVIQTVGAKGHDGFAISLVR